MTIKDSTFGFEGFEQVMREAVQAGRGLKAMDFDKRDDFKAYSLAVYYMQCDLSRLACAAKRGDSDGLTAASEAFYKSFRVIMTEYVGKSGTQYVAGNTEVEAYLPHVGTFRKQADGQYIFTPTSEAAFRKNFERTLILRIDGGEMRTAEEVRAAREAKKAAKAAERKAKKETDKQMKPDPKADEIGVYKDKMEVIEAQRALVVA